MKRFTLKSMQLALLIHTLYLYSCGQSTQQKDQALTTENKRPTQDEIIKINAEEYLKSNMNDPASYEFVKLELIDSITFGDNIQYRKEYFNEHIDRDKEYIKILEGYRAELPSMYNAKEAEELKAEIAKNERILVKIDSIKTELGGRINEVASYTYLFRCRGNNAFGAKILNEYILQTDPAPDFKIIQMTTDKDKVYLNPNDFPGYLEMIKKNL